MRFFDTKAFRELYLKTGCRVIALVPLVWWGVVTPLSNLHRASSETSALEAQKAVLERRIAEKKLLETMDQTFRAELENIRRRLQDYYDQQTYLRDINARSEDLDLALGNVRVTPRQNVIEVNFEISGPWSNLIDFCYQLETQATPTRLDRLSLQPGKSGDLDAKINLQMWPAEREVPRETD